MPARRASRAGLPGVDAGVVGLRPGAGLRRVPSSDKGQFKSVPGYARWVRTKAGGAECGRTRPVRSALIRPRAELSTGRAGFGAGV
jgi:hypothetical protein